MVDPFTIAFGGIILVAAIALAFWHAILGWAERSLFPWVERNLPSLATQVRSAFAAVDKVAAAIRRQVKEAWDRLREVLLKQVIHFQRRSSSEWVRKATAWVIRHLESGKPVPVNVVARKITRSRDAVLNTLEHAPEPDIVDAIESAVVKVSVRFKKVDAGSVDVAVEICCRDQTRTTAQGRHGWDELPETIRGEMLRTGNNSVERPWDFPWAGARTT